MDLDVNTFEQKWSHTWPQNPGIMEAPFWTTEPWVRFHTLPNSKRYADNERETKTILMRHHALLQELGRNNNLYLVVPSLTGSSVAKLKNIIKNMGLDLKHWRSLLVDPEEKDPEYICYNHLYVGVISVLDDRLDLILKSVAEDEISGVIISPPNLEWLYFPYDGGMDIIFQSTDSRDKLKENHRDWLPSNDYGM